MDVKVWPHKRGDGGLLCMPLDSNLPDANKTHKDWVKTTCPSCGSACWVSDTHKEVIEYEQNVKAVCTMCALKAGMRK
jgi:hypothetical protein